jgi:hypothetical protein
MKFKYILENLETCSTEKYKTFNEISDLLNLERHQVRALYIYSTIGKKHIHPLIKKLSVKYKLYDNPEFLSFN